MGSMASSLAQSPLAMGKKDKGKAALSKVLDKSREDQLKVFEKMFLTQVQHQDPLNPMSTNELTQNIMTFHSAAQQSRMNELLEQINANHIKSQAVAAKSYLNKEVEYQGREFTFEGGDESISFLMPDNIQEAQIAIVDANGAGVTTFPVSVDAGAKTFSWDGSINGRSDFKVPAGQYQVAVVAKNKEAQAIDIPVTLRGTVRKIGYHDESNEFALLVKNTPVEMSNVSSVRKLPASELISISQGVEEQIKRYDELTGYLKNKLEKRSEGDDQIVQTVNAEETLSQTQENSTIIS